MLRVTPKLAKQKAPPAKSRTSSKVRYHGIVADARSLGVSRVHLWFVLSGRRRSLSLLRNYHALKRQAA